MGLADDIRADIHAAMFSTDAAALAQIADGEEVPVSSDDLVAVLVSRIDALQAAILKIAEHIDQNGPWS